MNAIHWAELENIRYFPCVVVAIGLLIYRLLYWRSSVGKLAYPMMRRASFARQLIKTMLMALALIFLSIALLRPQWGKKETIIHQEGRDLFIALDISRSMLAADCKPNRLACAKRKIKELLSLLSCERVGLIIFSGSSFVQCPLTADYNAFCMFLDAIDVETISSGTTALDQALLTAVQAFKAAGSRKNKLLVLFTDGEDFSSNLNSVKEEVAQEGLTLFTIGVGTTQGAPIPLIDEQGKPNGHQLDNKGAIVISRLNEGILSNLASDRGGLYSTMTADDTDLKSLVRYVQRFEKEHLEDRKIDRYQEQYIYCVVACFVCLVLEWVL